MITYNNICMNKILKPLVMSLAMLSVSNIFAQICRQGEIDYNYLSERWANYQEKETHSLLDFNRRYFTDTVSVKEMKEAFLKYKDTKFSTSPYEGLDSVRRMGSVSAGVMPLSPLRNHPKKEIRESRGVWNWFGNVNLSCLLDKNGIPKNNLRKIIKDEDLRKCLNGEVYILRSPRWYMGYIVSPETELEIYQDGNLIGRSLKTYFSDFFAYSSYYSIITGGSWHDRIDDGARLLGALIGLNSARNSLSSERCFSVLLYAKTHPRSTKITYSVDLLLPENPDDETLMLFKDLRSFVESLPSKSFAPYYTTDMRRLIGRYYKVTVNKCGWLIEDYLNISQ